MKSIVRILSIGSAVLILFFAVQVRAVDDTAARFAGSFIVESTVDRDYYWYVHPDTKERYALSTLNDFSRLLGKVGQGITTRSLNQIPDVNGLKIVVNYAFLQRFKGRILLQVDNAGRAWYVNPLDMKRYEFLNNQTGYDLMKKIALDIRTDRLAEIPITKTLGFNEFRAEKKKVVAPIETAEPIDFNTYTDVFKILRQNHLYKDTFTDTDLYYGSVKGLAQGTGDLFTEFYPPAKNKQQQSYFLGGASLEGIGAVINARDNSIYVVSVIKDTPAALAGLRAKDQILAIDGASTAGFDADRAVGRIRGAAGTKVVLSVYRAETGVTADFTITRAIIVVPSVEGEALPGDIAYFKFTLFTVDLIPEFNALVAKLITPSTKGIVIDMRDNIGGVTQSSALLADFWLTDDQKIFIERHPGRDTVYVASGGKDMPSVPTVVLINEETASASEIFTSAMQYYKQARIIGTKTFGKGTGQNLLNFEDGSGLKYTTFEWLTAGGTSINKTGIMPDIVIKPMGTSDVQLERALQFIKTGY